MPPAPRRLLRSAAALAIATSVTGAAYGGTAAPARAASGYNGYCTTSSGVTVVVDFKALGGGVVARCAPVGSGASGIDALQAAGIPVQGTQRYGLAFVCRIYGKPASDPCVVTPPTNAHWDYFQASNGGSWTYSSVGASSSHVIPGGFEGWAFSSGSRVAPGASPVRAAPKPKPAPTHTATTKPTHTTTTQPPRHTRTTAPRQTATQDPAPAGGGHGSQPSSTTAAESTTARSAAAHTSHGTTTKKSRSASATRSTDARSSVSSASSSGAAAVAGGRPLGDSDKLIRDSQHSSGINATTAVGGGVLGVLAVGGTVVAIVRRRSLG